MGEVKNGKVWKTRKGKLIPYDQLADSHLASIIAFLERGIYEMQVSIVRAQMFSDTFRGEGEITVVIDHHNMRAMERRLDKFETTLSDLREEQKRRADLRDGAGK